MYVHIYKYIYHQQQNKWYPKGAYLPISNLYSMLSAANLLAHNNVWLCNYVQVNSLRLYVIECSFEMAR